MELIAKDGMWLTQANLADEAERGFWKRMHLAHSLSAEDFRDATDEEKQAWEKDHPVEEAI